MRTVRTILLSAVAIMAGPDIHGQQGAQLKLYVQPWHQVEFVLDGTERLKQVSALHLASGDHRLVFWAPGCSLLDTTMHVSDGQDMVLRTVLKRTPDFLAYQRACKRTWWKKTAWKAVPALVTLGFGLKALGDRKAHDQAFDDLHALRDRYGTLSDQDAIAALKRDEIPAAQDELDATRKRLTVSLALCGAGALATVYGIIRAKRYHYPEFEDKEKVRFDGLVWLPGNEGGLWLTGITIPLR